MVKGGESRLVHFVTLTPSAHLFFRLCESGLCPKDGEEQEERACGKQPVPVVVPP